MQSGPHGHPLLVTGQSHPRGWSSGHLLEPGLSICLHEIDTPVAALQDASESDIHVFFSGETEGAIPWAVDGWQSLEKQVTEARESGSGRLLLRPHHRHVLADARLPSLALLERARAADLRDRVVPDFHPCGFDAGIPSGPYRATLRVRRRVVRSGDSGGLPAVRHRGGPCVAPGSGFSMVP